ncbi:MAG: DUF2971 domain-containing protein [Lewinella sp.]|uniref:DUF2971 domain-containing protein n=1 Tax=Lewinella sp. TaxID=2004506 RepID=UPI003D6C64E3
MKLVIDRGDISVFKYYKIDKYLYDLIINHEVWFSDPTHFNDPFDTNLRVKEFNSIEDFCEKNPRLIEDEEVSKKLSELSVSPSKISRFLKNMTKIESETASSFGVSCFSYNNDEVLMWSHYSNNHQGVCIRFESKYDEEFFRLILDVNYTHKYPEINNEDDLMTKLSKVLSYKHTNWSYEEEIRVIKMDGPGLKKVKLGAIVEIIFGCKCNKEDKKSIIKLISRLGYTHVKFSQTIMKEKEFGLEVVPMKISYENDIKLNIDSENMEMIDKRMMAMIKEDTHDIMNMVFKKSIGPLYEELYWDAVNFILSLKEQHEREGFLNKHMPRNKSAILNSVQLIEQDSSSQEEE